jgi:hypothetical protein
MPTRTPARERDPVMAAAIRGVGIAALILTAAAAIGFGTRPALGAALGGAIATTNLWLFARIGEAFLSGRGRVPWAMIALIKLTALIGGVWLVVKNGYVPTGWLAMGYGSLPVGITIGSLFAKPPDDPLPPPTDEAGNPLPDPLADVDPAPEASDLSGDERPGPSSRT